MNQHNRRSPGVLVALGAWAPGPLLRWYRPPGRASRVLIPDRLAAARPAPRRRFRGTLAVQSDGTGSRAIQGEWADWVTPLVHAESHARRTRLASRRLDESVRRDRRGRGQKRRKARGAKALVSESMRKYVISATGKRSI